MTHRAEVQPNLLVIGGQLDAIGTGLLGAIVCAKVVLRAGQVHAANQLGERAAYYTLIQMGRAQGE